MVIVVLAICRSYEKSMTEDTFMLRKLTERGLEKKPEETIKRDNSLVNTGIVLKDEEVNRDWENTCNGCNA